MRPARPRAPRGSPSSAAAPAVMLDDPAPREVHAEFFCGGLRHPMDVVPLREALHGADVAAPQAQVAPRQVLLLGTGRSPAERREAQLEAARLAERQGDDLARAVLAAEERLVVGVPVQGVAALGVAIE